MFKLILFSSVRSQSVVLGFFETIDDLSRAYPISIDGSDLALWGYDPNEWDVVVFRLHNDGTQKEISPDPRVYLEDLAHPVEYN